MWLGILLSMRTKRLVVAVKEEVPRSVAPTFQVLQPYIPLLNRISVTDIIWQNRRYGF